VLAEEVMLKICYNAGTELTESKYLEKVMRKRKEISTLNR